VIRRIPALSSLTGRLFKRNWNDFHALAAFKEPEFKRPGVYLLAYSKSKLAGRAVKETDVFYVGMTCSAEGLRDRLGQFRKGIEDNKHHSAARRFYREVGKGKPFSKLRDGRRFYFVALPFECISDKSLSKPDDFITLGHICCVEYYAIARVYKATGKKPKLNKLGPRETMPTLR